ncbi:MAG: carboxypeptidase-like regulatory domain-containing protein, partial [Candidatus Promineifilaceae bacterium]|nr:carboxypeptidase-like regulatory domain-containing protein [Candidatus Promineifilaceae bacterium]
LGGSGIKNYSVYYRSSSMGTWQTYWGNTVATEAPFPGIPGETVDFLVRARDNAYNVGPWRDQPTDTTTFYRTKIGGKVVDNRGTPLESVAIDITPAPMFPAVTNELGEFAGYTIDPGDYTLSINQTGYLPTPSTNIADNEDFERNITLLPADTLFLNGTFEASGFLPIGWQTAGGMNVGITAQQRATGKYSVRMAAATSQAAQSTNAIVTGDLLQQVTIPASMPSPTLSFLASAAGDQFGDGTRLEVIVLPDGGSEIVVKPIGLLEEKWNHYWVDLQAFSGLKVDIIFRTTQDSTDPGITVFLDDISLGSAEPELWLGMSSLPRSAIMGDLVTIEIAYGNRGGVAANGVIMDVTLDNSLGVINTIPPATQNGFDLQWNLPDLAAKSGPEKLLINAFVAGNPPQAMKVEGEITSAVAETHTVNNRAELFIGNQREVLLPVIGGAPQ